MTSRGCLEFYSLFKTCKAEMVEVFWPVPLSLTINTSICSSKALRQERSEHRPPRRWMQRAGLWSVGHALLYPRSPPSLLLYTPGHLHCCLWCPGATFCLTAPWYSPEHPPPVQHSKYWLHQESSLLHEGAPGKSKDKGTVGQCLSSRERQGKKRTLFWNIGGRTRSSRWTYEFSKKMRIFSSSS